jgi:protein O-mannosyl-transferase
VFYPHPGGDYESWKLALAVVSLAAIATLAVRERKRRPWFLWGVLWYVGTLVPVLGLVQAGSQAMADRYTYVPLIGVFVAVAWGVPDLLRQSPRKKPMLATAAVCSLLGLTVVSSAQIHHWENDVALFSHAARVVPGNWLAEMNLGVALGREGRTDEAIGHYQEAVRLRPTYAEAYYNLGVALGRKGSVEGSIESYRKSLAIRPGNPQAHLNLGLALAGQGEAGDAERHYREALRIRPNFARAHNNLGTLLAGQGKMADATRHFREAVRIAPADYMGRYNLGLALLNEGKREAAAEQFREALRVRPGDPAAGMRLEEIFPRTGGS